MTDIKNPKSKLSIAVAAALTGISTQVAALEPVVPVCENIEVTIGTDDTSEAPVGSLRAAINAINFTGDCGDFHQITFNTSLSTVELYGKVQANYDVEITGNGSENLTISAHASSNGQVQFNANGSDIKLSDFTISDFDRSAVRGYNSNIVLNNMVIKDTDISGSGGAVNIYNGSLEVSDSLLTGNTASSSGGAVYSSNSDITLTETIISENTSEESSGGGLYISASEGDVIEISGSSIDGNTSDDGNGGGISFSGNGSSFTMSNSSVTNNSVASTNSNGAGLNLVDFSTTESLLIENSTISNNFNTNPSASAYGGGIYAAINNGSLDINASTIVDNTAGKGGGIYIVDGTTVNLDHTIVARNEAASAGNNAQGTIADIEYSLMGDADGVTISSQSSSSVDIDDSELDLGELADNGGIGLTHLPCDEQIVEAGATSSVYTEDQVGNDRLVGDNVDIGAIELQSLKSCNLSEEEKEEVAKIVKKKKSDGLLGNLGAGFLALVSGLALFRRKLK